jgi:hypothetical protein
MHVTIFMSHFFQFIIPDFLQLTTLWRVVLFPFQGEGKARASTTEGPLGMTNMVQGFRLLLQICLTEQDSLLYPAN